MKAEQDEPLLPTSATAIVVGPEAKGRSDTERAVGEKSELARTVELRMCGLPCSFSRGQSFLVLSAGSLGTAIAFSMLQEGVFRVEGFKYSGWLTLGTMVTFCICAAVEMSFSGTLFQRKGKLRDYVVLSMLTMGGMYLTNWSLRYLNYVTRIVFKSSKVVPTMMIGTLVQGRKYTWGEYGAAAVLILGVVLFTLGDADGYPNFHMIGVGLITLGVFFDALTSNFEEKAFFRTEDPSSHSEVIMYSSLIGAVYGAILLVWTAELEPALKHSQENPQVVIMIITSSIMGYLSVAFVLLLISHFGATNTEIVKSLRKVLTIIMSFILYPKPINLKYILGFAASVGSLYITHHIKQLKVARGGTVL